jgi:rfaE bifunctional protein nucleotidyltransferase chain/domain
MHIVKFLTPQQKKLEKSMFSNELESFLKKNKNKRIVFTNGCFDIIHVGHVTYLEQARTLGDALIVGLNSDQSVRNLKGNERPINDEKSRKKVLECLRSVDFVEIFSEETPIELIKFISPLVLVKGGDWPPESIVGYEFVKSYKGEVLSLPFIDGYSTTSTIKKIISK